MALATPTNGGQASSLGKTAQSLASSSGTAAMPVATCTPWVTRYSHDGEAGRWNQLAGCWARCE